MQNIKCISNGDIENLVDRSVNKKVQQIKESFGREGINAILY